MDVLRSLWPKAPYEIEGAGHMGPVTHRSALNELIDTFVSGVARPSALHHALPFEAGFAETIPWS